jgi:hypothetical protein
VYGCKSHATEPAEIGISSDLLRVVLGAFIVPRIVFAEPLLNDLLWILLGEVDGRVVLGTFIMLWIVFAESPLNDFLWIL